MLRSAAGKVMWVGRATVFVVGLSVILALVFGVATTAVGATGGNFVLGKANAANKVSKLAASVAGPALTLVNQSTNVAATALNIAVAPGQPPLKVNAEAGTATNLSADELDGKDSSDFYAAGSKVADSSRADQADFAANAQNASNADKLGGRAPGGFASASHDHDHRYSPRIFAVIKGQDASAIRSSNLQATFKYFNMAGSYEIVFDRDVSSCVYSATLMNETAGRGSEAPNGQIGVRPLYTSARGVSVTTYDSSGARADRDFSIVVHC